DSLVSLLNAAVDRRPKSKELRNLADRIRPLQEEFEFLGADLGEVEKIVLRDVKFEDVLTWVPRLIQTRDAVCRFEPQPPKTPDQPGPDAGFGSGFLVGPDVVMTADHNVVKYWGDQHAARQIALRFDCYKRPDGTVTPGTEHSLADDWQILRSPKEELDFALIRLARPAAADLIEGRPRGFVKLTPDSIGKTDPFFVLQHPGIEEPPGSPYLRAQPMKLSFGSVDRIVSANRVGYKVNTNPGSSGSPCATQDWRIVGLHHYGTPEYSQAVTVEAIRVFLQANKDVLVKKGLG